jgi:hypothetical protein
MMSAIVHDHEDFYDCDYDYDYDGREVGEGGGGSDGVAGEGQKGICNTVRFSMMVC